ncbi:hypothetical protein QOZ80_5AG0380160 [Eleusine coracana subsp. coracana]|nr:hypothetical protein QOZ80_5AG0380160 [Eleusine coracana subsp. coracana]
MDSGIHGEELSDWMSQLFEKLDLEVNEDNICSTGNVTEVEAHPVAKEVISPKIQMPTKLKDSSMAHTDINGFEWMSVVDDSDFGNEDAFLDWIVDMLKKGGRDDLLSQFDLDQADVSYDVQDELSDLDEDVEDSHTSVKRASNKETLENGIKWMSEECFLAFLESAERKRFEGIEHRFGELRSQCLNIEAYDKIVHHYNFTIEAKHGSSDIWSSELYFAEVKQFFGLKSYFCCLLERTDDGRCYGCQNMKCDLQHPSRGGYEEGNADICWPFIDETDSGSDDDCGFGC